MNESDSGGSARGRHADSRKLPATSWSAFLKDVFRCSLGAYGGPEAHMSVFIDCMLVQRNYLSESELVELMALCSILPGPTSTQTIVSIGYKTGGPLLALLTILVWALPVLIAMTLLSFLYQFLSAWKLSFGILRYVRPIAVGFIIVAAFRIGRKVVKDLMTTLLMLFGAVATFFVRSPWIFPVVLATGGAVSMIIRREERMWNRTELPPLAVSDPFHPAGAWRSGGRTVERVSARRAVRTLLPLRVPGVRRWAGGGAPHVTASWWMSEDS